MEIERRGLLMLGRVAALAVGGVAAGLLWMLVTAGSARADASASGSFQTEVPIVVPDFRGLEPRLRLVYDSGTGNGQVGVGWRLAGPSEVRRVSSPGKGAPRYDAADVYLLDGMELVRCERATVSPSCKHPPPAMAGSAFEPYATRSETYQRVAFEPTPGGGRWHVWQKDGTRLLYTAGNVAGGNAFRWTLSSVTDTLGNTVTYTWSERGGDQRFAAERYLETITYTGAEVRLVYGPRPDVVTYSTGRGLIAQRERLEAIGVIAAGKRARAYDLRYTEPVTGSTGGAPRSLLTEVQEYGTDATIDAAGAVTGTALPPVRLRYPDQTAAEPWASKTADGGPAPGSGPQPSSLYQDFQVKGVRVGAGLYGPNAIGDVNGDGRSDWVAAGFVKDQKGISVTTVLANLPEPTIVTSSVPFEPDPDWVSAERTSVYLWTLDLNGDGRSDLLFGIGYLPVDLPIHEKVALQAALSLGDGTYDLRPAQRTPILTWLDAPPSCHPGDLDGDGLADVACTYIDVDQQAKLSESFLFTGLSRGDGSLTPSSAKLQFHPGGGERALAVGDHDRDGRSDLLFLDYRPDDLEQVQHGDPNHQIRFDLVTGRSPSGLAPSYGYARQETGWTYVRNPRGRPELAAAEVDGDGRADFLAFLHGTGGRDPIAILTGRTGGRASPDDPLTLGEQAVPDALSQVQLQFTLGDANGDGQDDLLVASRQESGAGRGCPNVFLYAHAMLTRVLSNGDGSFALPPTWSDCATSRQVGLRWSWELRSQELHAGDTNGDGFADFLLAFNAAPPDTDSAILRDDVTPSSGADTHRFVAADVTGDTRSDLVYVQVEGNQNHLRTVVQQGDAQGGAAGYTQVSQHVAPDLWGTGRPVTRDWKVLDVNGDGRSDLLYSHCAGSFRLPTGSDRVCTSDVEAFVATGEGRFTAWRLQRFGWTGALPDSPQLVPMDVNGDGLGDLVALLNDVRPGGQGDGLRIKTLLATGDQDAAFAEAPMKGPFPTLRGALGGDTLNWRPTDVDGDGRTDLAHLASTAAGLEVTTLFARGDGDWTLTSSTVPQTAADGWTGIPLADTLSWRAVDANGDGKTDLVHLAPTATGLRVHTLLSNGDGTWLQVRPKDLPFDAAARARLGDTAGWLVADADRDGRTDFLHVASTGSGSDLRIDALLAAGDGTSRARSATVADPGSAGNRASPTWLVGDADGDGRADLFRVDPTPGEGGAQLEVSTLRSVIPLDLLTGVTSTLGATTTVDWSPAARFDPSDPAHGCGLPVGATVQVVAAATVSDGRGTASTTRYGYGCPRWSRHHRGLLGWTDVVATTAAAPNRPASTAVRRYRQTDECGTQLQDDGYRDQAGVFVATRELVAYNPPGAAAPFNCLPLYRDRITYGFAAAAQNVYTYFAYDEFGNLTAAFDHGAGPPGANNGDERTTATSYKPATDPWIVGLPWQETVSEGVQPATKLLRSRFSCYDGDNGSDTANCSGVPTKGLRTGEQRVDDLGLYRNTTYQHDAYGNVAMSKTPRKLGTLSFFDATYHLFPEAVTNPLGHTTNLEWDTTLGKVGKVTDANGAATSYEYDQLGRVTRVTAPGGNTVTRSYPDWGDPRRQRIREVADDGSADGLWTEISVDGLGRVWQVVKKGDAAGASFVQRNAYSDASGRVWRRSGWFRSGRVWRRPPLMETLDYDLAGRLVRLTHPDRAKTGRRFRYDTDGTTTSITVTDERGHDKTVHEDAYGRVVEVVERERASAQVAIATYTWSAADELLTATDPNGNVTTNTWDPLGQLRKVDDPDMGVRTFDYDLDGNLKSRTDARNRTVTWTWDALGRPATKILPGGLQTTWTYDEPGHGAGKGRLTSVTDPSAGPSAGCPQGRSEELSYSLAGQLTSWVKCIDGLSYTMGFAYDQLGRQRQVTYPDGETVTSTFDRAGRLASLPGYVDQLGYDAAGRLERVAYANGTEGRYAYDPARRWLDTATVKQGSTVLYDASYTYEPDGLVAQTTSTTNQMNLTYGYDDLGRLKQVSGDVNQAFGYDAAGNLTTHTGVGTLAYPGQGPNGCTAGGTTRPCKTPHALSSAGSQTFGYDGNGNLSSVTDTVTGKSKGIDWTDEHQPAVVSDFDGVLTHYAYDAGGQRVSRRHDTEYTRWFGPWVEQSNAGLTKHYYAGSLLVASKTGGATNWYHADHLGSVRLVTGVGGSVVRRTDYTPFGERMGAVNVAVPGADLQFGGHRTDADNGLVHMRARDYDPRLAHFISPDTIIPDLLNTQALNRYAYTYNSPVSFTDPSGHEPEGIHRYWYGDSFSISISVGTEVPQLGRPAGQVCSACHGGTGIYDTPFAIPPPAPQQPRVVQGITGPGSYDQIAGAELSLTGLRFGGYDKPRANYLNPVAGEWVGKGIVEGTGYVKWAELLEAGHTCAACHLAVALGHVPTDAELDLDRYRQVSLWTMFSRMVLEMGLAVGNRMVMGPGQTQAAPGSGGGPPKIAVGEIKPMGAVGEGTRQLASRGAVAGNTGLALYDDAGNVHFQVFSRDPSGTYQIVWEGPIGRVTPPANIPPGTSPFGNAMEAPVRQLVGGATGQTFLPKAPNTGGPDLIPIGP
jgi:RHS repeat-associated protein